MKKLLCLILTLVLIFALFGCGEKAEAPAATAPAQTASASTSAGPETEKPVEEAAEAAAEETGLNFRSGEVVIRLGEPMAELTAALGEPNGGTFESPSCAYQGSDYYYYYDSLGLELTANELNGTVCLTAITLIDDTVTTPEGLRIGMEAAAADTCGLTFTREDSFLSCEAGNTRLRLQLDKNDCIGAINYTLAG